MIWNNLDEKITCTFLKAVIIWNKYSFEKTHAPFHVYVLKLWKLNAFNTICDNVFE